jgi:hypothetical protein
MARWNCLKTYNNNDSNAQRFVKEILFSLGLQDCLTFGKNNKNKNKQEDKWLITLPD